MKEYILARKILKHNSRIFKQARMRLKKPLGDFLKRVNLLKSKNTTTGGSVRQVPRSLVLDTELPVPTSLLIGHTGNAAGEGENVKLEWRGEADCYQYVVIDKAQNARQYYKTSEASASLLLEPGAYNIMVRACSNTIPMRHSHWSAPVTFAVTESYHPVFSLEVKAYLDPSSVLDTELPVPTGLLIGHTGNAAGEGENVKLEWRGKADCYQYVVIDKAQNAREYYKTSEASALLLLEPGAYRILIRACSNTIPMRHSHWSAPVTFAVNESYHPVFGLEVKAYLDPSRKDYYLNCQNILQSIANKEAVLATPPLSLAVLLEGRGCNLRCIYCTHIAIDGDDTLFSPEYIPGKKLRHQVGRTFGTSETLINSINDIATSLGSIRFGGGEPLVYPEFKKVAGMVKNHPNIVLSVCTNANLITDEMIDDIFLMPNFRWLAISIDAATKKTYEKIRVKGNFEKVCNTIKKIIAKRGDRLFPKVQFNFVIMKSNYKEVLKLLDLAKDLGVEAVNYIMLIAKNPTEYRRPARKKFAERLWPENLLAEREKGIEILGIMEQVRAKAAELGIMLRPDRVSSWIYATFPELRPSPSGPTIPTACAEKDDTYIGTPLEDVDDSDEHLDYESVFKTKKFIDWKNVFCHQPFTNFSAGHYRLNFCCYAKSEFNQLMFFDNDELTVMDLWNHPKIVEARKLMYEGRADLVCSEYCPFLATGGLKKPDLMI